MEEKIKRILKKVRKPARYVGGEVNMVVKNPDKVKARVLFVFPDTYEIGMSHLGMRILYALLNEKEDIYCERTFAPWSDMQEEMEKENIPLFSLETQTPAKEFDLWAVTLQYEMSYISTLNLLKLSGFPLKSADRGQEYPIVIAGGPCCYNPAPMREFIDVFVIGEGEEVILEISEIMKEYKGDKKRCLEEIAKLEGAYVPSINHGQVIKKRFLTDFDAAFSLENTLVPLTEIVHDRIVLEVFRGCIRGCRFCQAGFICRPVRERSAEKLMECAQKLYENTGYEEISLSSLSTSDYTQIEELLDKILDYGCEKNISVQVPSLRADNFSDSLLEKLTKVRKSGLTFAPEAGSQRLRDVINKNLTEEEILTSARRAFAGGYSTVKLYFMLGLPGETDEDILAIGDLANKVYYEWKTHGKNKARGVKITVSASLFVPKAHTPFQWCGQNSKEEFQRKTRLLRDKITNKSIVFNWHEPETSIIEAVLARGDEKIGAVLENCVQNGGFLDSWSDFFSFARWETAFAAAGIDYNAVAQREIPLDEPLPWDNISTGVRKEFLKKEYEKAKSGQVTPNCRQQCTGCMEGGVCHV